MSQHFWTVSAHMSIACVRILTCVRLVPSSHPRWWCGRRCGWHRRRRTRWRRVCWLAASCAWWLGRSGRHELWRWRWAVPFRKKTQDGKSQRKSQQKVTGDSVSHKKNPKQHIYRWVHQHDGTNERMWLRLKLWNSQRLTSHMLSWW